jgi:hypothetical protein
MNQIPEQVALDPLHDSEVVLLKNAQLLLRITKRLKALHDRRINTHLHFGTFRCRSRWERPSHWSVTIAGISQCFYHLFIHGIHRWRAQGYLASQRSHIHGP